LDKRDFLKGSAATAAALMMGLNEDKAFADDSVPRTNWSGNYHYSTNRVLQPASVAETQDAVRSVAGVRALGTRHSFNGIADSQIAQISTLKLKDVTLDAKASTVTVGRASATETWPSCSTRRASRSNMASRHDPGCLPGSAF
jgi:xylitol oxidase